MKGDRHRKWQLYDDTDETFTMLIKSKEKKVIDAV